MTDAASIITAEILKEPGDLAGVPPAIVREVVRRAMEYASDLVEGVQVGESDTSVSCLVLVRELDQCLTCADYALTEDAHDLGWRQDSGGESFCAECYSQLAAPDGLEEDEGEAGMPGLAAMGMEP